MDQTAKFEAFKALHEKCFVIPNPWDAGSTRLLAQLGFAAMATTSAGFAFTIGVRDSHATLTRDAILANARLIVEATDLPVSADLEDGFGVDPETCAETIRMASDIGLVGGSIEDATGDPADPIHAMDLATDRIRASAETARDLPFLLTARAENYLWGRKDLADTIARLQAFSEAGADVLYAPGLTDLDEIATLCRALDKPVNVVMGLAGRPFTMAQLADVGVKRISLGGSLARAALGAVRRAGQEIMQHGTFGFADDAMTSAQMFDLMSDGTPPDRT